MSALAKTQMTVDECLATADKRKGRWEIESGVADAMAPEPLAHARVKGEAFIALHNAIRKANLPCGAVTDSIAVWTAAHTAYQPDALVYRGPREDGKIREINNPLILVEVTSPSTGYFSLPSVVHYLLLYPDDRTLVHHKRAEGGLIETRILSEGPLRLDSPGLDLTI